MDRFAHGISDKDSPTRIVVDRLKAEWLWARDMAVQAATNLNNCGVHYHPDGDTSKLTGDGVGLTKQLCNRLLEPFMWHTAIISATDWDNFFALRCPRYYLPAPYEINREYFSKKHMIADYKKNGFTATATMLESYNTEEWLSINKGQGEIHIMALAEAIWDAINESTPNNLEEGEWHIPFNITGEEASRYALTETGRIKIAVARCARVSYTIVGKEGKPDNYVKDIELYDRLATSGHFSPFEHVAYNTEDDNRYGNFKGWKQQRQILEKYE
jgi:hypothetical protein